MLRQVNYSSAWRSVFTGWRAVIPGKRGPDPQQWAADVRTMRCMICEQADIEPGTATVTLTRGNLALVVRHVPAHVCPNCGEEYVDERIAVQVLAPAEQLAAAGTQVDVREYVAV